MQPCLFFYRWLYMSGFKTTQELLEETPVSRLVIRLGIPAMFGQLFNILYNIVDRIFIGKIPETGSLCLASIGVCAPALTALTAFAFMVGIGGASYMSISLGQKEERRAREIIGNAFFMILVISAAVTPLLLLNREKILYLLGSSKDMYPYAETYFTIYVCGTFASLLGCGLNQFILAQGFARQGMISVALGAVVNVVLDPIMIFGCGMGIAGAAWGTVILELNRMAFDSYLPRNSESRAISMSIKLLKKYAPQIKWVISFADACSCGDGTIYRASNFVLTGIKENLNLAELPDGSRVHKMTLASNPTSPRKELGGLTFFDVTGGTYNFKKYLDYVGATPIPGFQLRYIYFIDKTKRKDLTVPEIPFSKIDEMGAGMYKGEKVSQASRHVDAPG